MLPAPEAAVVPGDAADVRRDVRPHVDPAHHGHHGVKVRPGRLQVRACSPAGSMAIPALEARRGGDRLLHLRQANSQISARMSEPELPVIVSSNLDRV